MKCIVIIFLLAVTQVMSLDDDISFDEWQTINNMKFLNVAEKRYREKLFNAKKAEIREHNKNPANTYKKGLNKFSHLSSEEFTSYYCGAVVPKKLMESVGNNSVASDQPIVDTVAAPASLDLRYLMQPVQNQRNCGSCWAFAVMAQLEGQMKKKNSAFNIVLSPQYLIDCDSEDSGCNGGWPETAMNWIKNKGGNAAPSMSAYTYTAAKGTCKSTSKVSLGIKSVSGRNNGANEEQLKNYVATYGPITVSIYATSNFQSYHSGIFYDSKCTTLSTCSINHAVVVVGYGSANGQNYWLVKNSWGTGWGESGYVRMARNRSNNCMIACYPMWAIL